MISARACFNSSAVLGPPEQDVARSATVRPVLREECAFKGMELPRLADLQPRREAVEAGWVNMLNRQIYATTVFGCTGARRMVEC